MIHGTNLILPYAMSDIATNIAGGEIELSRKPRLRDNSIYPGRKVERQKLRT
jgi:hypothetical protein